jgi:hypothetical protein
MARLHGDHASWPAKVPRPVLVSGLVWGAWHVPLIVTGQYASGPHPLASALLFLVSARTADVGLIRRAIGTEVAIHCTQRAQRRSRFTVKSSLAMLIGLVIATVGIIGLISPQTYVRLGWFWADPPGLYVLAAIQLVIGLALLRAAPSSRSPVGLGVLGAFALAEAVLMPLLGRGRTHGIAQWWGSQTTGSLRLWALLELAVGVLIVCAVAPRRRALPPSTPQPTAG